MDTSKLSKVERAEAVRTYRNVVQKVIQSDDFTAEEKRAMRIVTRMVNNIAAGWGQAGRQRDTSPSKSALYFRWNRAKKAVAAAEDGGMRGVSLSKLRAAAALAEEEYRAFPKEEKDDAGELG